MAAGGSLKPSDGSADSEARVVLRVPECVPLRDGRIAEVSRLKLRQIIQHAGTFVSALAGLTAATKTKAEETDKAASGYAFIGSLVVAIWDPLVAMLELATNLTEADYDDMDAEDMLNIVEVFVRIHQGVAKAFFGVLEAAGMPVAALKAWFDSLKQLMSSLGEDTGSTKSESSTLKS